MGRDSKRKKRSRSRSNSRERSRTSRSRERNKERKRSCNRSVEKRKDKTSKRPTEKEKEKERKRKRSASGSPPSGASTSRSRRRSPAPRKEDKDSQRKRRSRSRGYEMRKKERPRSRERERDRERDGKRRSRSRNRSTSSGSRSKSRSRRPEQEKSKSSRDKRRRDDDDSSDRSKDTKKSKELKMELSDEDKRWIVVGIAMNKVAVPVLRDEVKKRMDIEYAELESYCRCRLKTLNHDLVHRDSILSRLKFENINNNYKLPEENYESYNFNILNGSIDLAKLYLPFEVARQFSAFDESMDMTPILHLLEFRHYRPNKMFTRHTQTLAKDVRDNVRNKWGHFNGTEWTNALFNDCFEKLKNLVKSLRLEPSVKQKTLDQLDDWQRKGCQLITEHTVDKNLLRLVKDGVTNLKSQLKQQKEQIVKAKNDVTYLRDQGSCREARLDQHRERLDALEKELQLAGKVWDRLVSFEEQISMRLQAAEEGLVKTGEEVKLLKQSHIETVAKVDQLEQRQTKQADEVELLKHSHTKTADEVELLKKSQTETAAKADQLDERCAEVERIGLQLKTRKDKPETSCMKSFDLNSCRSKLEDHYQKSATVPTSVCSQKSVVDIHQIYTRLSWVKEEQTPTGTTQSELKHYSDLFTANKNGVIPKRILVQGQTGIGKSTFVKKLLVDWVEVNKAAGDEQAAVLKNFELVVAVNLKEVSKCQSLKDVIRLSNVFAKEDKCMTENLVDYISNNQEKVLLIFDGYDEYRSGCDSEIYEIFSGNSLRSCCVLITTRISKADELRGSEDLHAEITGFSEVDREVFMRRFLNSEEASKLEDHLYRRELGELAKVPLLLLLFCILWREGQSKSFPNSKTQLYVDIVQFILNHSHSKQTADKTRTKQYVELKSFKEILSEIGKVALQSLLKDDHLFEYSQLSDSVCCDESIFIGLLQITEYSETLRPVGMVSFIHKSIQEFLAAWYITYRCIPEGGNLDEISVKLEECLALENVFQFICGLSKHGASTVFRHFKSVRISDPSLDLSKAIPDVENETDEPLSDVTERQRTFIDLVLFSFAEVESEDELSSSCLDSLGNILFVSHSFPNYLLEKAMDTNSWSLVLSEDVRWRYERDRKVMSTLNKIIKILFSKGSQFLKVAQFLTECNNNFGHCSPDCGFSSVLCFCNDQVFFYITHLKLECENHSRLFTDNVVAPHEVHSTSGQVCVKFLKTLECDGTRFSMKSLGAVIKHCNHLERIVCKRDYVNFDSDASDAHDSVCHLLEQVQNPDRCSLSFKFCALTSTGAVKLASLLPRFENVTLLHFSLVKCSTDAVTRLVAAIKHKTLKRLFLEIHGINMMSAVVEVLCQSLPELLALKGLRIHTLFGCSLLLYNPVGLHDSYSFPRLDICGLTNSSAEAVRRLIDVANHNFLSELRLEEINPTPAVAEVIVQLLPKLSALQTLGIKSWTECSDEALTRLIEGVNHKTLEGLRLCEMNLTSVVAESLGRLLPELSALETLVLSGSDGCNLQQKEIEAMFGRFSRPSSLRALSITRFSARGSLASLAKKLCFFPCLESLQLQDLDMGEADLCSFLENLKYIPDLEGLYLMDNPLSQAVRLMAPYLLQQKKLVEVWFREGDVSEEDLNYVQEAVKEKRPQLRIDVHGLNESISFLFNKLRDSDFSYCPVQEW